MLDNVGEKDVQILTVDTRNWAGLKVRRRELKYRHMSSFRPMKPYDASKRKKQNAMFRL